jgi:hypothetical protein
MCFQHNPLPWGEGGPLPAFSPAGAGRVRGYSGGVRRLAQTQLCGPETSLKSGRPITLKRLAAQRKVVLGQVLQPSARKMPFVGGHDQR